jgi:FkbM family methyltransferase
VIGACRALLPNAIKPRRIVGGPLRGAWLVTSWRDYPGGLTGRTERALLRWFATHVRPGDTWLDVGAHYGYTAFALGRLVGATGRVFAFEPVATTAQCVDQGRVLNGLSQLTVLPVGLGAADGTEVRRLGTSRGMADSTLHGDQTSWADVPLAKLDWLWPQVHGGTPDIHGIKIDVQGMEIEALAGMRGTLTRWRPPVVLELHSGVDRSRVLSLLASCGYSMQALAIDPARDERTPRWLDNRSYAFSRA